MLFGALEWLTHRIGCLLTARECFGALVLLENDVSMNIILAFNDFSRSDIDILKLQVFMTN